MAYEKTTSKRWNAKLLASILIWIVVFSMFAIASLTLSFSKDAFFYFFIGVGFVISTFAMAFHQPRKSSSKQELEIDEKSLISSSQSTLCSPTIESHRPVSVEERSTVYPSSTLEEPGEITVHKIQVVSAEKKRRSPLTCQQLPVIISPDRISNSVSEDVTQEFDVIYSQGSSTTDDFYCCAKRLVNQPSNGLEKVIINKPENQHLTMRGDQVSSQPGPHGNGKASPCYDLPFSGTSSYAANNFENRSLESATHKILIETDKKIEMTPASIGNNDGCNPEAGDKIHDLRLPVMKTDFSVQKDFYDVQKKTFQESAPEKKKKKGFKRMCLTLSRDQCRGIVRNRGLISFILYFAMVGLAAAGICGKTQYSMSPIYVNMCMYGSLLCLILGLVTACLVTTKEGGVNIVIRRGAQSSEAPVSLPPEYQTQLQSPLLTVSVLDMECGLVHSTVPFFTYPVVDLQVLLPNRYGSREQVLGVHMPPMPGIHGQHNNQNINSNPEQSSVTKSENGTEETNNNNNNNENSNENNLSPDELTRNPRRLHSISESPELRTRSKNSLQQQQNSNNNKSENKLSSGDQSPPSFQQAMDLPPDYTAVVKLPNNGLQQQQQHNEENRNLCNGAPVNQPVSDQPSSVPDSKAVPPSNEIVENKDSAKTEDLVRIEVESNSDNAKEATSLDAGS